MALGGKIAFTLADGKEVMQVNGEAVYYTRAVNISKGMYFGLKAKALSAAGSVTMKIELQQSDVLPTTEGAADLNYVVADGASDVYTNLNDEIWHVKAISPVPMTYVRLKITGLTGNNADATLQAGLFIQDMVN